MRLFLAIILFTISCKPAQKVDEPANEVDASVEVERSTCNTFGTVKKASLDGCSYLIYLENGKKLEPVIIENKDFKLEAGQKIRFSYEPEQEVMSICMAAPTVRVTCIELRKKVE
jgi:hypothetical protein